MEIEAELESLAARMAASNAKALRRSLLYGAIAFSAGALWMVYAVVHVRQLNAKAAGLETQIGNQRKELGTLERSIEGAKATIANQQRQIDEQQAKLRDAQRVPPELNELLTQMGWSPHRLGADQAAMPEVRESLRANRLIGQEAKARGGHITFTLTAGGSQGHLVDSPSLRQSGQPPRVVYFAKKQDADPARVVAALKSLRFNVQTRRAEADQPTNTVVFGSAVNPEDAKLVALALIRAGVPIKALYRSATAASLHGQERTNTIQVIGYDGANSKAPLTVKDIEEQNDFVPIPP